MNRKGFTLVETVLALTILSIGLFGVMNLFHNTVGVSLNSHLTVMASALARERLEKMIFDKKMNGFDYIQENNYPATETFTGDYAPFTRAIQIVEVDGDDLSTPRVNTDYRKITVTVTWTGGNSVSLETLVTLWGEET